jgi:hypothetical protein
MEIEVEFMKKEQVSPMKKRNKRTETMAHMELTPITEQILAQMGPEGAIIRKRLKIFFYQKTCKNHGCCEEYLEQSS